MIQGNYNRLWFLMSFAVALILLILWSQPSQIGMLSGQKYNKSLPEKIISKGPNSPPILAYWILGSKGENKRILRLLKAIYHPRNQYLLHLDSTSSNHERMELALSVHSEKVFEEFGNVNVVGKSYAVNKIGASGLAAFLHAAAMLLRINKDWDWFIPLSTSDYPILTQDGSPWMILSRSFTEHCVNGLDNLPRKLLMYFNNVPYPLESYFHTLLCNTPEFQNKTVNDNLRYIITNTSIIEDHSAIFVGPFDENDRELQEIDEHRLSRGPGQVVPGKWCTKTGLIGNGTAPSFNTSSSDEFCSGLGDIDALEPGDEGIKLQMFLSQLNEEKKSVTSMCKAML
ncbi:hypothetical protein RD792_011625 [Penstemon davidsonii]|uniref:Uncharacterized protein n=1 Tax=Penstemon davidsonii TaxID=160366 RepID=A0ABR0CUM4_9LAMI|nr:hypothetical protein RD792_011625 [Penstemon davidsonii]